jgi:hypothetical protein
MSQFKYLGTTVKKRNFAQEEIKRGLNCYHLVLNLMPYPLLSTEVRIRIWMIMILPVSLFGLETWALIIEAVQRLKVLEKRVLWRKFGLKGVEVTGVCRKLHSEELRDLYSSPSKIEFIK